MAGNFGPDQSGGRVAMVAAFGASSVANYAFSLLMGRLLLPGDFGQLAFVQTLLLIAGLVLESGVPWALARVLVDAGPAQRRRLIRGAAVSNLGIGLLMALALVGLFLLGPLARGLESWNVTLLAALSLPLIAVVGVLRGAAQGSEAFTALALISASEVVGKAVVGTLLVVLGLGIAGAVGGFVAGALLSVGLGALTLGRRGLLSWRGKVEHLPRRSTAPMFGALLGGALLLNLDLMLLKVLPGGGRTVTGQYQAASVLANAPYFLASSVVVPLAFTQFSRAGRLANTREALRGVIRQAALFVVPLLLLLIVVARPLLRLLFPASYGNAVELLQVRSVGIGLLVLATLLSSAFQATGAAGRASYLLFWAVATEAVLLVLLVPRLGALGAALAFAVAALTACVLLGRQYVRAGGRALHRPELAWWAGYFITLLLSGAFCILTLDFGVIVSVLAALTVYAFLLVLFELRRAPEVSRAA
ncbi:oligosaccharide flippase family protein [Deinococcus sp.]|uniref:oligosaccharide flippase family protein n=1 Tax=Deinococcus sp. TaxID=47478 RepID=UPI0025C45B2C|nr:oligosaccharide flippase family protein [Deinococcus sp.]